MIGAALAFNRRVSGLAAKLLIAGSFLFVVRFVRDGIADGDIALSIVNPLSLAGSFLLLFFVIFSGAFGWWMVLRAVGEPISYGRAVGFWVPSLMSKYLPGGGLTYLLGRVYLGTTGGVSARTGSFATVIELGLTLISTCLVFVFSLLSWSSPSAMANLWIVFAIVPVGMAVLHPRVFAAVSAWWAPAHHKGKLVAARMNYRTMLLLVTYYCFHWFALGTAFYLMLNSFWPIPPDRVLPMAGVYAIGCTVGMLAPFAPNGLGVREAAIASLLSVFLPPHVAGTMALLARLWYVGGEILGFAVVSIFRVAFGRQRAM